MRTALALAATYGLFAAFAANADDLTAHGWSDFYARADYGQMGVVQSNGQSPRILVIRPDSPVTINERGTLQLVLNHYDRTATHGDMTPTYVAVLALLKVRTNATAGKPTFYIFRNSGWMRPYCRRASCFDKDGTKQLFYDATLPNSVRRARESDGERNLDDIFGAPFDGVIDGAEDIDSWTDRSNWNKAAACDAQCEEENFLLRFTPSAGSKNMTPLQFDIAAWSIASADIYTFSPTEQDFANHYVINFR